ncbi:MAG: hypothetical protein JSS81_20870 [Acidobacteria bacterium]|nr:hypothetical protein [Acidobacteriota bacterium]
MNFFRLTETDCFETVPRRDGVFSPRPRPTGGLRKLSFWLLLAAGLIFQTGIRAQSGPTVAGPDGSAAEFKEAGWKLLAEVERETKQYRLPANRIQAQTIVADLMWTRDEEAARAIFRSAFGELQGLFAGLETPAGDESSTAEKARMYDERYRLAVLRREFLLTLAARDSRTALDALAALKAPLTDENDPLATDELELELTAAIAKKDPDTSYTVARKKLDADGITYQFVESLKSLHRKDSKLAASLGRDLLDKIRTVKIRVPAAETGGANPVPANNKTEIEFLQLTSFLSAAVELNRTAEKDKTRKTAPLLSGSEMKELAELTAGAFLAERSPAQYAISEVLGHIARFAPALAQQIRRKLGPEWSRQLDKMAESNRFLEASREKTPDELAKIADVSAPDVRDFRLSYAVSRALEENDPEKAQAIAARIGDRKNYAYLFEQIQTALPLAKARRGDLQEVRRMLAGLKTDGERIAALTELASAMVGKDDRVTARALLDEALQLLPPLKNRTALENTVKIAVVYSAAAPDRAFELVENSLGPLNDFIGAGVRMDEFDEGGAVESDELLFTAMNKPLLMYVPNFFELFKNLARADFERAVRLAEKFDRPEIRQFARLRLAQAVLDENAAETERRMRDELVSDGETD